MIDVTVDASRVSAYASEKEVIIGARLVVQNCIFRKIPSFGGIAKELGESEQYLCDDKSSHRKMQD